MNTAGRFKGFAVRIFLGAFLVLAIGGAAHAAPAAAGGLSGAGSGPGGGPLQDICVYLYDSNGGYVDSERTDVGGGYAFTSLAAGQ